MNAKEAREKALKVSTEYSKIKVLISKYVDQGEFEFYYAQVLTDSTKLKLTNEGYKILIINDTKDLLTLIKW